MAPVGLLIRQLVKRGIYIGIYHVAAHTELSMHEAEGIMQRIAKIFWNNRGQAVRLPEDFQFNSAEVFIRRQGAEVVLSPRPTGWDAYLTSGPLASPDFMQGVEELPLQERVF